MGWIPALQYGFTGLAAVLGFFVAAKIRTEGKTPTKAGERLIGESNVDRFEAHWQTELREQHSCVPALSSKGATGTNNRRPL
jgi:hypothetical protein